MSHSEKKYAVITSIWKVFAILLEYCCRTDYKLLIQAIAAEHQREVEKIEAEYEKRFAAQTEAERRRKEVCEGLERKNEELERELREEK